MSYEWDEEVPQPKPPTRRCKLAVLEVRALPDFSGWTATKERDATQADIARALGVTDSQLQAFLDYVATGRVEWFERQRVYQMHNAAVGLGGKK